jgi:hypothetical protein
MRSPGFDGARRAEMSSRSFFRHLHKRRNAAAAAAAESRGERGSAAQSQWSSDRPVGAGRLVWPTGADTRRKHGRRNVARFVASRWMDTRTRITPARSRARTYTRERVVHGASAAARGEGEADGAERGPKGNCAPLAGTVHDAVIATISRVYRICIRECRANRVVRARARSSAANALRTSKKQEFPARSPKEKGRTTRDGSPVNSR